MHKTCQIDMQLVKSMDSYAIFADDSSGSNLFLLTTRVYNNAVATLMIEVEHHAIAMAASKILHASKLSFEYTVRFV